MVPPFPESLSGESASGAAGRNRNRYLRLHRDVFAVAMGAFWLLFFLFHLKRPTAPSALIFPGGHHGFRILFRAANVTVSSHDMGDSTSSTGKASRQLREFQAAPHAGSKEPPVPAGGPTSGRTSHPSVPRSKDRPPLDTERWHMVLHDSSNLLKEKIGLFFAAEYADVDILIR
jgi:hypothetical protein